MAGQSQGLLLGYYNELGRLLSTTDQSGIFIVHGNCEDLAPICDMLVVYASLIWTGMHSDCSVDDAARVGSASWSEIKLKIALGY